MTAKSSTAIREEWIGAFVKHVRRLAPEASEGLIKAKAERLYPHLGHFGPIEVAEAEWEDVPSGGGQLSLGDVRPRRFG